jgi:dihydroorotate dehydrogenase
MLAETYVRAEGLFPLIGAGGIDSGATALAKFRAGASLIQLYSALVFRGLGLVAEIKAALIAALERDRLDSLIELVGTDAADATAESWPQ